MAPLRLLWGWVLMAAVRTGAISNLVDQSPRWALIRHGQAETLHCSLRDTQYPWMSWYQQDLQGQLQILASPRLSGDKEVISLPGADYQATRVSDTELRLQVANVTQGRTLYCTCSEDTKSGLRAGLHVEQSAGGLGGQTPANTQEPRLRNAASKRPSFPGSADRRQPGCGGQALLPARTFSTPGNGPLFENTVTGRSLATKRLLNTEEVAGQRGPGQPAFKVPQTYRETSRMPFRSLVP